MEKSVNSYIPCPFCGSDKIALLKNFDPMIGANVYAVKCRKCGALGGRSLNEVRSVSAWNKRA